MYVIPCSKRYCENIMCRTQILGIGNVCIECQKEFKYYLTVHGLFGLDDDGIREALREFLTIPREKIQDYNPEIDEFFKLHTDDW